jgi:hypothetical protein
MDDKNALARRVIPLEFQHIPPAPDMSLWPFDVPWIMRDLRKKGLTVIHAGDKSPAEVYDATGQKWMHRALRAESHLRDCVSHNEAMLRALTS